MSTATEELLERAGPAIAAGSAIVVSVEAIRERSGERWPRKSEQVKDFVTRAFQRIATPADVLVPLNGAEFLTLQPEVSHVAAVSRCTNLLKETLLFFLGTSAPEDIRILQVTGFEDGCLKVRPVDPANPNATSPRPGHQAPFARPSGRLIPATRQRAVRLEPPGIDLQIDTVVEPIWSLSTSAVVSNVIWAEVAIAGGGPTSMSLPAVGREVAMAGLEHARAILAEDAPVRVGLHCPAPLGALTQSTSRYRLLETLRAIPKELRRLIMFEITGATPGLPQGRLAELVGLVSPFCRAVLARAPDLEADLRTWRNCNLAGVTVDCGLLSPDSRKAPALLAGFARSALEVAPACVGYRLGSRSLLLSAWAAGFTHLSGPAVSRATGEAAEPRRLTPFELYREAG